MFLNPSKVAITPTVYGIETVKSLKGNGYTQLWLQQHLPFTVLKLNVPTMLLLLYMKLQQHLPFTVLKRCDAGSNSIPVFEGCNNTYRLRY